MTEKRDNSGILFKNNRKDKDTHPDYTGNATIDGRDYWISAWLKEGAKGKFFSFAFKPKDDAPAKAAPVAPPQRQSLRQEMNDDIPF